VEDIDHTRTEAGRPQTSDMCERFHKTVPEEFYRITFRRKIYRTIDELQLDLDQWLKEYNEERFHQGDDAMAKRQCRPSLTPCP
jgi:transposase InsO family protein